MVTSKIEKTHLRIFALVNVGMWCFVVWDVVKGHPWRLPSQLIGHKGDAGAAECCPYFFDIVVINDVRTPYGKWIERYRQHTLKRGKAIAGYE